MTDVLLSHPSRSFPGSTTIVQTTNDIAGTFVLGGELQISTTCGNVDILIDTSPEGRQIAFSKPSKLSVETVTGSIRTRIKGLTAAHDIHYESWALLETHIKSQSGSISADVPHGKLTNIVNGSGDTEIKLYPLGFPNPNQQTRVQITTDVSKVIYNLRASARDRGAPKARNIIHEILGKAGSIHVFFPMSWEGAVQCTSTSRKGTWDWRGLAHRIEGEQMVGKKGNGLSTLTVFGETADIKLQNTD